MSVKFSAPLCWILVFTCLSTVVVAAPDGKSIYRKQCASCHGAEGQGVKGKYDDALYGEWNVDRLTRYIHKNMPEEKPELCVDADAAAVAAFIHDSFYSPEARLRKNPPRMDLARLTNRQHLNSVADLLKQFTGGVRFVKGGGGLKARYESGARIQGIKASYEQVDAEVNFDYGTNSPNAEKIQPDKFQITWRGSVIADETGDHEFVVRSPNGIRLWVNGSTTPLIDAYVASGAQTEHRATIRLIGGRAYPLELDFFKFNDATASIALEWKPPHGVQQVIPARNLSTDRVDSTFVLETRFPADDSSAGYERGVQISKAWDEAATQAAIETANQVVARLDALARTRKEEPDRDEKLREFGARFVEAAWRRPLTGAEREVFVDAQFQPRESRGLFDRLWSVFSPPKPVEPPAPEDAVKRVVLLALKSPQFLYPGLSAAPPDSYVVASRLSYALWDSVPDAALLEAAVRGELVTRLQVEAQARRMMNDPRARAKVREFLHHWLQLDEVEDVAKDATLFPGFDARLVADLRVSLDLMLEDVFWSADSDYRRLLTDEALYANKAIATFYGFPAEAGDGFQKVADGSGVRSGVVTHPYLMAAFSYPRSTSPIHRGVFLTRNIVGRALKQPPMAVEFKEEEFDPSLTMREKVVALTKSDACQACHSVINPLGFTLEQFDAVGRFRAADNGHPVDAAVEYQDGSGRLVRFEGARDLAMFAADNPDAHSAFIGRMFQHVAKQPMLAYDFDLPRRLREGFVAGSFNMQRLMIEIAMATALHGIETKQLAQRP